MRFVEESLRFVQIYTQFNANKLSLTASACCRTWSYFWCVVTDESVDNNIYIHLYC